MLLQKIAFRIVIGITLLGLVATVYGYYSYRRPLPQTEGAIQLVGLREEVTIYRDEWGVPHIYAATAQDLFFAQGYIHAQDRWWQMEMNRHIGSGSLSAIMGNDEHVQNTDRFIRTLGWNRIAAAQWEAASSDSRRVLQAYARGVNGYVESRSQGELAVQYTVLGLTGRGFEVNPWEPVDTLAWLTAFAWQQSGNFLDELHNAQQLQTYDDALLPPYLSSDLDFNRLNLRLLGDVNPADLAFIPALNPRSSAWVVSGEMTASGLPLLANDIQSNTTIPSDWYEVGLHCIEMTPHCPYDVVGFSLAGVPGVIVGHNGMGLKHRQCRYSGHPHFGIEPAKPASISG
jgi:penicillin G amidase